MTKKDLHQRERYPSNAEGDFYVENGICLCCMAPEYESPELWAFDNEAMHCYFKRQPETPVELQHAIAAVAASDIQGLRYGGTNKRILRRVVRLGAKDCCDALARRSKRKSRFKACLQRLLRISE